jgi:biofilm protein TabA
MVTLLICLAICHSTYMLIGHLNHPDTYQSLLNHPIWQKSLAWLKHEAASQADGEYEIEGREIFAIVQTLTTIPRSEGVFEAHRQYIDIHYCIEGEEIIEWAPVDTLTARGEFNAEKDYGHYEVPEKTVSTHFTPGILGIYLPADAHMPKIVVGQPVTLKKVVVKIRVKSLAS